MSKLKSFCTKIISSKFFEGIIMFVIILNSVFIGVEMSHHNYWIYLFQNLALIIFTLEIFFRFFGSNSVKEYFKNGWNVFDLLLVLVAYIPDGIFENTQLLVALRVLRVFRVLRLLKAFPEVRLIVSVLIRSFSALTYNALFFTIFLYLFSIIGMTLFKMPTIENVSPDLKENLILFQEKLPGANSNALDPYGTLPETWFTLFKILTGDDWAGVRYNLLIASELNLIHASSTVITIFHVVWYIFSAFLLLNLLVGAILNNYQIIMEELKNKKESEMKN